MGQSVVDATLNVCNVLVHEVLFVGFQWRINLSDTVIIMVLLTHGGATAVCTS